MTTTQNDWLAQRKRLVDVLLDWAEEYLPGWRPGKPTPPAFQFEEGSWRFSIRPASRRQRDVIATIDTVMTNVRLRFAAERWAEIRARSVPTKKNHK
jgi:hypothetical protein